MTDRARAAPLVAAVATTAVMACVQWSVGLAMLLGGWLPLLVPLGWCVAWLCGGDRRWHLGCLAGAVIGAGAVSETIAQQTVGGLAIESGATFAEIAIHVLTYAVAGVAAAWSVRKRWSWDRRFLLVLAPLVLLLLRDAAEVDLAATMDQQMGEMIAEMRENPPSETDEIGLHNALHEVERGRQMIVGMVRRFWPAMVITGQAAVAGFVLGLGLLLGRIVAGRRDLPRWPAFVTWRMPWYFVWVAVVGLALTATRIEPAAFWGVNIAAIAGCAFGVQGLAIQVFIVGRVMSRGQQVLFWLFAGIFAGLVLTVAAVALGIADQWLDLRGRMVAAQKHE